MSTATAIPTLFASATPLEQIDWLKDSSPLEGDIESLHERMVEDVHRSRESG